MAEIKNLPNLIIIGAPKCGTTSLFNYLGQHNDIYLSKIKEPHFLVNKKIGISRLKSLITSLKDYHNLFDSEDIYKYKLEASALYLFYADEFVKNAKKVLEKDVKIIVCLRNPVERSYSAYNHLKRYNIYENLTFEDALKKEKNRFENDKFISPAAKYFEIGLYYQKIKKILYNFHKVKIIIYEEFVSNPNKVLKECTDFLEIDSFNFKTNKVYMKGGWRWKSKYLKQIARSFNILRLLNLFLGPKFAKWVKSIVLDMSTYKISEMNVKTKKILSEKYSEDIDKLSKLLNRDLSIWKK